MRFIIFHVNEWVDIACFAFDFFVHYVEYIQSEIKSRVSNENKNTQSKNIVSDFIDEKQKSVSSLVFTSQPIKHVVVYSSTWRCT